MSLDWGGDSTLDVGRVYYRGPAGDNAAHRHAALQLVLRGGGVRFDGGRVDAPAYVRPMAEHQLEPSDHVELYLIEPSSRRGQSLLKALPADPVGCLPEDVSHAAPGDDTTDEILPEPLTKALSFLSGEDAMQRTVQEAAAVAGVSVSRLRVLAKNSLGVSLSRWRLWQALQSALRYLADGESVADAAFAAGFSDQAHLTRSMKATLGLTPGTLTKAAAASQRS